MPLPLRLTHDQVHPELYLSHMSKTANPEKSQGVKDPACGDSCDFLSASGCI